MENFLENIEPFLFEYKEDLKRIRRDLHQIPETGLEEFKTTDYIISFLEDLDYKPERPLETGAVLFIKGNIPGDAIALRSDIDALTVSEPDNKDFVSKHPGMMHACGHDGHMAMLLETAKILKEHPEIKHKDVLLIFQPAEEGPGGAEKIVDSGVLDKYNIKEIYGYHLFPFVEEGYISTTPGEMMAMTSEFYPVIKGKSSHAGEPEKGIDALVAASQFVLSVQTIKSRNIKSDQECLINIGTFNSGEKMNIVPKEARLTGTMRSYNPEVHKLMKKRLEEILRGIDIAFNTQSQINYTDMYPPVINDKELFEKVWEIAPEPKKEFEKVMLAEDFSMYDRPYLFIGLGTGSKEHNANLHSEGFDFNEDVLLRGVDLYLRILGI